MRPLVKGDLVRFPPGNKIRFYQDHGAWEGMPDGVIFQVEPFSDSLTKLTAHGYGELLRVDDHDPHQYGNGAIFIPTDSITEEMVQPIMDRWLETLAPTSRRGQPPV